MIEVAPAPADGPGLAEMARASGAALSGLRLADGALILKVERAGARGSCASPTATGSTRMAGASFPA